MLGQKVVLTMASSYQIPSSLEGWPEADWLPIPRADVAHAVLILTVETEQLRSGEGNVMFQPVGCCKGLTSEPTFPIIMKLTLP